MSDVKAQLVRLDREQLVALGKQKTDTPYRELLAKSNGELIELLAGVENVLVPVQA